MYPRCWLPRRSWRLEHNQCRSLYYFPKRLIALFAVTIRTSTQCARPAPISPSSLLPFSTGIVDMPWKDSTDRSCMALTGLHQPEGNKPFGKIDNAMGVTIELQNLGMLSYAERLLPVSSTQSVTNQENGGWPSPGRAQARTGGCELMDQTALNARILWRVLPDG